MRAAKKKPGAMGVAPGSDQSTSSSTSQLPPTDSPPESGAGSSSVRPDPHNANTPPQGSDGDSGDAPREGLRAIFGDRRIGLVWKRVNDRKIPYYVSGSARAGEQGSAEDLAQLVTYAQARACFQSNERTYAGVGVAMIHGQGLLALDFDDCIDEDESTLVRHRDLIRAACEANAYAECSPSGRGIRVFMTTPKNFAAVHLNKAKELGIEVYSNNQFVTVTERPLANSGTGAVSEGDFAALWEVIQRAMSVAAPLSSAYRTSAPQPLPETEANIERVRSALLKLDEAHGYGNRDKWRNVIYALRSLGWDRGNEFAHEWSENTAGNYDGPRAVDEIWNGKERESGPKRTYASLFYEARQCGWDDPLRPEFVAAEGELGLSRAFAERHAGDLLFSCADRQWLRYERGAWRPLRAQQQVELAKVLLRDALSDATRGYNEAPTDEHKRQVGWAIKQQTSRVADAVLSKASADRRLAIDGPEVFDRDPSLLNVRNGVVDLRTGLLIPHDPEHRMMRQANASFFEGAALPSRWLRFLNEVTLGDAEYVAYLQRVVGLWLTGHVKDEVLFFMFGFGANGKSVFCNVIQHILSDYAVVVPARFLMVSKRDDGGEGATPALATLAGARLALANETESTDSLSAQMVKAAVSTDSITARKLHSNPVTFAPTHKLVLRGNHKPIIRDTDYGLWRRVHLLTFGRTFKDESVDPRLAEKLLEEADAILAWAVGGSVVWHRTSSLRACKAVLDATKEYQTDSDVIGLWLEDRCDCSDPKAIVEIQEAFNDFKSWCAEQGLSSQSLISLTKRLVSRGIKKDRKWVAADNANRRCYVGLKLQPKRF